MDTRLVLAILLLVSAVALSGGVEQALRPVEAGFALFPGGPMGGALSAVLLSGPMGASPELSWSAGAERVAGYALIAENVDLQGDGAVFWAIWNIPADARRIPAGIPRLPVLARGVRQARTVDGDFGYQPPSLTQARQHRLRFTLVALEELLHLDDSIGADQAASAIYAASRATTTWRIGGAWR